MPEDTRSEPDLGIERANRAIYDQEYVVASASTPNSIDYKEYFGKLTKARLNLIRKHGHDKTVLDICCGTGDYLFQFQHFIKRGVGVDFSPNMIFVADSKKKRMNVSNIQFAVCNARRIPFQEEIFDVAYSFSSLYYIPRPQEVVSEAARVLKSDSIAILEFGNLRSLNTIVSKAYPNLAISCHIEINEMEKAIRDSGLQILEHRRFQILPMWGDRPKWLKPLMFPFWKQALQREVGQKMVDELLCGIPILRRYSFRHLFVCKKG